MSTERWGCIGVCALAMAIGLSSFWLPAPLPVDAPLTEFSATRALQHVQAIARAPHPMGSAENARVREYVKSRMSELGLKPRELPEKRRDFQLVNLYGELGGTEHAAPAILLVSHYDSTTRGPGAADDASGVGTVLETVRALQARGALRNTLGVLITDGEEAGLLGARAFVLSQANLVKDLRLVVNLEARGNHGPVLMFESGPGNSERIRLFGQACPLPVAASFSEDIYRRMPNDSDFSVFRMAGKRGFNFAFVGGINYYHSPRDTPENLSLRTLQHYGECVLPLATRLGSVSSEEMEKGLNSGDATFFTLCRGMLVRYPAWLAKGLAWGTGALFALAVARGCWRGRLRKRFVLAGLGTALLASSLALGMALGFRWGLAQLFKPAGYGPFLVGLPFEGGFLACILLVVAAATLGIRAWLLRRASMSESLAGPLIVWVTLTLTLQAILPGACYLFLWPALFGTIALLLSQDPSRDDRRRWLLRVLLTAAPAPMILAPTILLLLQGLTIGIAPVFAVLVTLAVCLLPMARPTDSVFETKTLAESKKRMSMPAEAP